MSTESEVAARAEQNRKASAEAMRLAAEAEQRDVLAGRRPVQTEVQDLIKEKLEKEQFSKKPESN